MTSTRGKKHTADPTQQKTMNANKNDINQVWVHKKMWPMVLNKGTANNTMAKHRMLCIRLPKSRADKVDVIQTVGHMSYAPVFLWR